MCEGAQGWHSGCERACLLALVEWLASVFGKDLQVVQLALDMSCSVIAEREQTEELLGQGEQFSNRSQIESRRLMARQKKKGLLFFSNPLKSGGEGEIRTPGTLLTYTRFPIVLLRPARTPLHSVLCTAQSRIPI